MIIGGETGVGKTRLMQHILDEYDNPQYTVLTARCIDYGESPLPFGPVIDALRPLDARLEDETRRRLLEPVRRQLLDVLPRLDASDPQSLAKMRSVSRQQLFEALLSLFEGIAAHSPVVLVIEDLHWADRSTRDLLAFLIANLHRSRVAMLVTYRNDELGQADEFLRYISQLQRSQTVSRLHLPCLAWDELLDHLDDISQTVLNDEVMLTIWKRSQGNPYYAEELLTSSLQAPAVELPDSLHDMLLGRMKGLHSSTQKLLRIAAVGGVTVEYEALAFAAGGTDQEWFHDAVRDAFDQMMLVNDPHAERLSFRHTLLHEVAYNHLLPSERRTLHARYAQWMDDHESASANRAAERARHHFHARNDAAALTASLDAAEIAERSRGYTESHVHLERAIDLWARVDSGDTPVGMTLVDLLQRAASISHLEGDNYRATALVREALAQVEDVDSEMMLRLRLGSYLKAAGESEEALDVFKHIAADVERLEPAAQAEVLCAYAQSLMDAARHHESIDNAERGLAMAQQAQERAHEATALTVLGCNKVVIGQSVEGIENLRRALQLAEELDQPTEIAAGYSRLASTLSGPLNRFDEALEVATLGIDRVKALGLQRHWGVTLQSTYADTLFRMGRWDEADAVITEALRRVPRGAPALDFLLARIKLDLGRGHFDAAATDLREARLLSVRAIDMRHRVPLETLTAGLALWEGRIEDARTAVQSGLDLVRETDDVWFAGPLIWHGMRAEAERAANARAKAVRDEVAAAVSQGEQLRELSRASVRSGESKGTLDIVINAYDGLCEGELARIKGQVAVDVWTNVARLWDELSQPYPGAYSRCRLAEALLARPNGQRRAIPALREAHAMATTIGALPLDEYIVQIATRAGIDIAVEPEVINLTESNVSALVAAARLTRREIQVLELVAAGESNKTIAETCFISEKTASVHVSNIMSKLGVGSRSQVAALVHRASL